MFGLQAAKHIVRYTVCLVHEEIVTFTILSVLRVLVALELNQCSILATIRGFSLIRLEPVEQPSGTMDDCFKVSHCAHLKVRKVLSGNRDDCPRIAD